MEIFGLVALILVLIATVAMLFYDVTRRGIELYRQPPFSILDWIWPTQTVQHIKGRLFTLKCPFCRSAITERDTSIPCPNCSTRYHNECSIESGKCSVFGCRGTFLMNR